MTRVPRWPTEDQSERATQGTLPHRMSIGRVRGSWMPVGHLCSSLPGSGAQAWCQDPCVVFRVWWEAKLEDSSQENSQYSSQGSCPETLWRMRTPRSEACPFRMASPLRTPSPAAWLSVQLNLDVRVAHSVWKEPGQRVLWEPSGCHQAATGDKVISGQQAAWSSPWDSIARLCFRWPGKKLGP